MQNTLVSSLENEGYIITVKKKDGYIRNTADFFYIKAFYQIKDGTNPFCVT
jgi:hypothetical protein